MSIQTEAAPIPPHHPDNFEDRNVRSLPELMQQAEFDSLTGSNNRNWFDTNLPRVLEQNHSNVALLYVDVDRLKETNELHGHAAGHELLKNTVTGMRNASEKHTTLRQDSENRPSDIVVRLGGDEFAIVLFGVDDEEQLEVVKQKVREELHAEGVSASIGGAVHKEGESAAELEDRADKDQQIEKRAHRQEYHKAEIARLPLRKRIAAYIGTMLMKYSGVKPPR